MCVPGRVRRCILQGDSHKMMPLIYARHYFRLTTQREHNASEDVTQGINQQQPYFTL